MEDMEAVRNDLREVKEKISQLEELPRGDPERVRLVALEQRQTALEQRQTALEQQKLLLLQHSQGAGPSGTGGVSAGFITHKEAEELAEKVADKAAERVAARFQNVIGPDALERLKRCVFVVEGNVLRRSKRKANLDGGVCVGFFFAEPGHAATANHCLPTSVKVGDMVPVFIPHDQVSLQLRVVSRNKDLDVAILKYDFSANSSGLGIPGTSSSVPGTSASVPGTSYLEVQESLVPIGERLALCTCSLELSQQMKEPPSFAVFQATLNRYSRQHYVVYDCPTFQGDCGSALVMYNGKVVGLHVEGVNQLKERISKKKDVLDRLSAVEESLDSAIACTSHGAVAVLIKQFARLGS